MNKPQKVLLITCTLEPGSGGWGRYSIDLVSALRNKGVKVIVHTIESPLSFKRHFFLGWWEAFKLYRKYKNDAFDVVHCAVEPYLFLTSIFAKMKGLKYVATVHGTYAVLLMTRPIYGLFQKYAYRNAAQIIAVSNYTKFRMGRYLRPENIVVIPNGFASTSKEISREGKRESVILSVGGIKERKGYHLVIMALSKIKDKLGEFKYYIVGAEHDPIYAKHLRNLAKKEGMEGNVVITGAVSPEKKESLYGEARIFVLPSLSEGLHFEGFGLVYLEASAHGLPAIGCLDSGAEDAIKNGETGFLVPQGDIRALAGAILKLFEDKELAERMSGNGLRWAKNHDWNIIVSNYIETYDSVIKNV